MKIAACEGVMLGTVSTFYDVDAVLIAVRAATISLFLLDPWGPIIGSPCISLYVCPSVYLWLKPCEGLVKTIDVVNIDPS